MTDSNITLHPILDSVVHRPFKSASRDASCSEFTERDFAREITPYIPQLTDALLQRDLDIHRLWTHMMAGEVIAVEFDRGTMAFHVQGRAFGYYIDMRFVYHTDLWTIQAITSIHRRPVWRSRVVTTIAAAVVGMAATGVIGYAMADGRAPVSQQAVESWAGLHGYALVKNSSLADAASSASDPLASGTQADTAGTSSGAATNNAAKASSAPDNAASTPSTSVNNTATSTGNTVTSNESSTSNTTSTSNTSPKTFQFAFRSGMTVHDISAFLQQHQLVKNAYAFDQVLHKTGVEKKIWPGTYTFKSTMTQAQILKELQSHPSS